MPGIKDQIEDSNNETTQEALRRIGSTKGMNIVNIHKAKTHLSRLVEEAAKGQPFIIAKAGKPMVKVVPLDAAVEKKVQRLGFLRGQNRVPDQYDALFQEEIIRMFEGEKD